MRTSKFTEHRIVGALNQAEAAPREGYEHALVLSRPDQHVARRGEWLPDDPAALVDRVRGAGYSRPE